MDDIQKAKSDSDKQGKNPVCVTDYVTDNVTDENLPSTSKYSWMNVSEEITTDDFISTSGISNRIIEENETEEIIEICERSSNEFRLAGENVLKKATLAQQCKEAVTDQHLDSNIIPDVAYWHSILTDLQECEDFPSLQNKAEKWQKNIPPLQPRVETYFKCQDVPDSVAQKEIPPDGPVMLRAVYTIGDGNCLPRSAGKGFFNDDNRHIEIRTRIVLDSILNKKHYLSHECLERGATVIHGNADLPSVFATFSEFYTPGQKLTPETVEYIYTMEIYSCAWLGSYMGIWQLAQTASVLGVPLHTVYPVCGESTLRTTSTECSSPLTIQL